MESRRLSKEEQKFTRVALICVDFLQLPLIDILEHEIKPADLFNKISTCSKLANGKGLQPGQQRICFLKPPNEPDYNKFDVTLLYKLLRNLCSSLTPQQDWGKEPQAIDTLIVHDIERLRLFRNEIAHAVSSEFSDAKFEQFWKKVESVIQRIQNFTSNLGCKTNYLQRLKKIKTIEFGYDDLEKYKFFLESIIRSDQPEILIKGDKEIEVLCGDTACFELELKQADLSHWTVTWHKMIGTRIEQINTSTTCTRYSDSTDRQLVIHSVCKEDKGNYQAVLSEKVRNGKSAIQVVSNVISLHTPGEPPFSPELKVTNGREDIFVQYKYEVPEKSPKVCKLKWTKDGVKLDLMNKKYNGGSLDDDCLTIKSPTPNDRGIYCCTVSNAVGSESQEVKLDIPNATIFKDTTVYFGSSTKLGAEISSCPSPDVVKWQRSRDGNSFNFIDIDEPEYFRSTDDIQSPLLRIPKATSDVQLFYRLYLRNKLGENISNTIYLNITGSAPNIMVSHDVCFQNNSVKLIGKVYLDSGKLPAIQDVFWTKDGGKVDIQGSGGKYCEVGVDDPSLIIHNVSHRDIGSYQLTATNAVGSTRSDVIVLGKPQIVLERTEKKEDGNFCFTMTIKAIPEPTEIRWSLKENKEKAFELLNIHDDDYKGTTDGFPHPVLVVKFSKYEQYKFQLEVKNFTGKSSFIIQGEKTSKLKKSDNDIIDFGKFYIDGGASVRFSDISNEIAENFPREKINKLKDIIQDSCKVEDASSLEQAVTPRDILRILKNNKLFTPSDVICMQYLLKRTDCQDLYTQCIKYAEEQDALCFYEKPLENGFRSAEFHVRGNISDYSKELIEKIIETVASVVGCSCKEIHVNGNRNSSSFFVVLSMKEPFTRKLLSMEQDEKDNLFQLNIDYIIVDNDIIYLEHLQDNSAKENSTIPNIIRMPREGGSRSGSGRSYVDNAMNRSLGRVGMPVDSIVVSRGSSAFSSGASFFGSSSSDSGSSYVDNAKNRSLGRVGMPLGPMVVSKGSSAYFSGASFFGSSSSESGRTYVDNSVNRNLRRVGMPVGTMSVSKSSSGSSSLSKIYVDNEYNRRLGRVGKEHGSMVVLRDSGSESSCGTKHYVDNSANRSLGRVGLPYRASTEMVRVYKDNPLNLNLRRAGIPIGATVKSKSESLEQKFYTDNPANYRLGRVGFPLGSRPRGSFSGSKRTYCDNYLNRQLGRVGKELGTEPVSCSKETEWLHKAYIRYREKTDEDIDYRNLPALPEEVEEDAIEKLMYLINRLHIKREWLDTEKQNKPVPKTSDDLLSYTGPILEISDIKLGKIIGRGGFGVVHYGKYKDSVVAVKKLHVMRVSKRRQKEFIDEVNILSKLNNPFIVKCIGACTTTPDLCIVLEYMQMSLHEALHVDCADLADFTDGDRLMMITQTLTGLEYLHAKNVAHCDIKSRNVLIDHNGEKFTVAKLTDFGLSLMKNETETSLSSNSELVRHIGTPRYSSPEVLRGELMNLDQMKMSDMYSYGLVVFEIVCEEEPFHNLSTTQLRTQVREKKMYPIFPDDIHPNVHLAAKLLGCWDRKPEKRPTATDFLKVMNRISCVYETLN